MIVRFDDVDASERAELLKWIDGQRAFGVPQRFLDAAWDALQADAGFLPETQPDLWDGRVLHVSVRVQG